MVHPLKKFKDWSIPGFHREKPSADSIPSDETCDALSGGSWIYQLKEGHRFSTDDILVAWFGTTYGVRAETALDLGSGIGSVAQVVAWRLPGVKMTTVEAQEVSFLLSKKSVAFNGYSDRFDQRLGDFREPGVLKADERFDLIFGSPPYWPETDGVVSEHPQKRACRFEVRGGVGDYCVSASAHLAPGGMFFLVFPTIQEERTLGSAEDAGLQCLRRKRVILKEGEDSLLSLYQFIRADDLPGAFRERLGRLGHLEAPLLIRDKEGKITLEYSVAKGSIGFPP
jgi:tRNA1Val (adenine37-N6)-methyltransferase